jgi:hypothetical protein
VWQCLRGWKGNLAAVQWLIAQGARWPLTFGHYLHPITGAAVPQCWSLSTVQWAVASGSGWLDRKCDDYALAKFTQEEFKTNAADVLNWAHANGCPCTCGHQQQLRLQL